MTAKWMMGAVLTMSAGAVWAQAPAAAPAGAMGICRDGSYSTAASKDGACRGHKGVQTWYGSAAMPAPKPAPAGSVASMPAPTPASRMPSAPAPTPVTRLPAAAPPTAAPPTAARRSPAAAAASRPQQPGGGPGLVWVNTGSNVYHCNGDPYYGRTKAGAYMSEADAKAKGAHGERGESCAGK